MPVTLTWIGHATWLIDTGSGVLLIDPFLDDCPTASMKAKDVHCDAILVTHAHADHVSDAAAIAKRLDVPVLCNFEIANWLGRQGVKTAQPMNHGGRLTIPGGTAKMEGVVELAEEIFHMPVRVGYPQSVKGLNDIVRNPIYATGVGLLQYGQKNSNERAGSASRASVPGESIVWRFKAWLQSNF